METSNQLLRQLAIAFANLSGDPVPEGNLNSNQLLEFIALSSQNLGENEGSTGGKTRKILAADTVYYVDIFNGNDANTGEQNSPFATIKKALDLVDRDLDLGGYQLTIQIATGDYTSEGLLHLPVITGAKAETCGPSPAEPPNSQIRIIGAGETTVVAGFELDHHAYYSIENLKLASNVQGLDGVTVQRSGVIELKDLYFVGRDNNYLQNDALVAKDNGIIYLNNNFYFYNFWQSLFTTDTGGRIGLSVPNPCFIYTSENLTNNYLVRATGQSVVDLKSAYFFFNFDQVN